MVSYTDVAVLIAKGLLVDSDCSSTKSIRELEKRILVW